MIPVENVPGMVGGSNKGEWIRGWIQVRYILRTFVNAIMYPHPAQQEKINKFYF
jgi:hypothetical protein